MNQETIFVVDDNPRNLNVLFDHLEMSNFRVMGSISGELALEAIPQVQPDLILLDIMMPGIDGFETCRRLKANPETRDIPVIFITALADTSDEVKGLEIGAVDYITKPIKIEMVLARVRTHLALRRMQKQVEEQNIRLQQEIAERNRIEAILRKYERIVSATPDFISLIDREYRYQIANAAYLHALNKRHDELIGHTIGEFVGLEPFESRTKPRLDRCFGGETIHYETWLEFETSGRLFLSITYAPYIQDDNTITGVVVSARNITPLKQTQEELEESEERFRAVFENVVVGVTVTDPHGRILQVNRRMCDMLGYDAEDLLQCTTLTITHPDDAAVSREKLQALFRGDIQSYQIEKRYLRKDGSIFWGHLSVSPIRDRDGRAVFSNGMIVDITERKEAEAQLRAAHRELSEKNEQLHELNANKDKFFSIIAHDLRSPFNALLGYTELINDQFDTLSQAKLKEYLGKLQGSAERLYALLENLLTWSRIQRGIMEYSPERIELATIAADNVALFLSNAERKQLTLANSIQSNIVVYADYAMANTVMRNLISNALKFTPTGGTVAISARQGAQHVEVTLSDTGVGMDAATIAQLFRIDAQHTTIGTSGERGTGLGLLLCHDLVKKNGGEIWVESEVGKGTTFRFTLPLQCV